MASEGISEQTFASAFATVADWFRRAPSLKYGIPHEHLGTVFEEIEGTIGGHQSNFNCGNGSYLCYITAFNDLARCTDPTKYNIWCQFLDFYAPQWVAQHIEDSLPNCYMANYGGDCPRTAIFGSGFERSGSSNGSTAYSADMEVDASSPSAQAATYDDCMEELMEIKKKMESLESWIKTINDNEAQGIAWNTFGSLGASVDVMHARIDAVKNEELGNSFGQLPANGSRISSVPVQMDEAPNAPTNPFATGVPLGFPGSASSSQPQQPDISPPQEDTLMCDDSGARQTTSAPIQTPITAIVPRFSFMRLDAEAPQAASAPAQITTTATVPQSSLGNESATGPVQVDCTDGHLTLQNAAACVTDDNIREINMQIGTILRRTNRFAHRDLIQSHSKMLRKLLVFKYTTADNVLSANNMPDHVRAAITFFVKKGIDVLTSNDGWQNYDSVMGFEATLNSLETVIVCTESMNKACVQLQELQQSALQLPRDECNAIIMAARTEVDNYGDAQKAFALMFPAECHERRLFEAGVAREFPGLVQNVNAFISNLTLPAFPAFPEDDDDDDMELL
ncbi:hypothetical protein BS50DRAFT_583171 [Corynespora cassiicola Philippines]|uniref:Uncharacterized protein n=1 Tax=Corynespora cassiicola Philippines TaxID=1448308 RepID=A0A2T2P7M7_CORCC|nr:hypothetical protein BS50DRAFT_583171 [Corynespora cassiicola Philippines]